MKNVNDIVPELLVWGITLAITIYMSRAKNPYPPKTDEYQALRLCRIGFVLDIWSFGFGLVGIAFAIVGFILGIIGIVKGRVSYGIFVIVLSVILPFFGMLWTFQWLIRWFRP